MIEQDEGTRISDKHVTQETETTTIAISDEKKEAEK